MKKENHYIKGISIRTECPTKEKTVTAWSPPEDIKATVESDDRVVLEVNYFCKACGHIHTATFLQGQHFHYFY